MGAPEGQQAKLAAKFEAVLSHLDERQRRLLMGGAPVDRPWRD